MKTSKKYFERFKTAFLFWQKELGLTQYRVIFYHQLLKYEEETYFAQLVVGEKNKLAQVSLTTNIKDPKNDDGPESHAKHEAIHLLLHRLRWLGGCRYIESTDLDEEWEAIVVRLEKVLGCELINNK